MEARPRSILPPAAQALADDIEARGGCEVEVIHASEVCRMKGASALAGAPTSLGKLRLVILYRSEADLIPELLTHELLHLRYRLDGAAEQGWTGVPGFLPTEALEPSASKFFRPGLWLEHAQLYRDLDAMGVNRRLAGMHDSRMTMHGTVLNLDKFPAGSWRSVAALGAWTQIRYCFPELRGGYYEGLLRASGYFQAAEQFASSVIPVLSGGSVYESQLTAVKMLIEAAGIPAENVVMLRLFRGERGWFNVSRPIERWRLRQPREVEFQDVYTFAEQAGAFDKPIAWGGGIPELSE